MPSKLELLILVVLFLFPTPSFAQTNNDVTSKIENLGNPFTGKATFARNVWDMQSFNNKIYLAHGDYEVNAGPIDLFYYNIASSSFEKNPSSGTWCGTSCVDEEEIESIRTIDNTLVIPGTDARDDLTLGNYYRLESGNFKKYRTIPNGAHIFDIYKYNSKLFTGIGSNAASTSTIQSSVDNGISWQNVSVITPSTGIYGIGRVLNFFELGGKLYAWASIPLLLAYDGVNTFNEIPATTTYTMFPTGSDLRNMRSFREVHFNNQVFYIGVVQISPIILSPYALYKMSDDPAKSLTQALATVSKIDLPENATPSDNVIYNNVLYVLGNIKISDTSYIVTVSASSDGVNFNEILRFNSDTFARSFEYLNGDFYFGMGTETTPLSNTAGNILRFKKPNSTLPGDIVVNGKVDIYDYNQLLTDFGRTGVGIVSDINPPGAPDGKVDIYDYNLLLTNFGK